MVARRRPQVLGDGNDVAAGVAQIAQGGAHLVGGFAQAEDEVALGDQAGVARSGKHTQAAPVRERRPDPLEDTGHGFDIVCQDFRAGLEDLGQPGWFAVEVGNQQFDAGRRIEFLDGAHGRGVQPGPAVRQVVASHAGDGGIAQAHRAHAVGDSAWLVAVQLGGLSGVDLAEIASAGALVTADQEGGFSVLPAFEDVGAAGLLADRVQPLAADQVLQLGVLRPDAGSCLDPRRFALDWGLRVAHLQA
ncbi:Uncharacterised protein [Mycobacterium tuberculosis]|nr:Uncharacterised protein [Mycobacterium tuberculosis]CKT08221.1 Uncharacterised protein [Mycobacterium tuberculosis]CNV34507.1 Uncharacterised protein [Mycobacterium tuberculosis]